MAIQATNYDKDKEYLIAEIKDVPYQNLLINGDFKINQRGQSSYVGGGGKYGLDLWYQYQTTLTVTDSGIILTSSETDNNLMQILPTNLLNKTLTFAAKIDGVIHSKTFVLKSSTDTYSNEKFNIKVYSDSSNRLRFIVNIVNGSTINIEYIDLFEGSIVYPHVEEDDAIALLRSQEWVYGLITEDYARLPLGHLSSDMIQIPLPFINFKSPATVEISGNFDIRCIYPNWWNIAYVGSIAGATFLYSSKMFQFTKPSLSGSPESGQVFSVESQPGARIIITREPL